MKLETGAVDKLRELIAEEANPELKLRVFVQGGGCSGFSYGFTLMKFKMTMILTSTMKKCV